jgi:predicted permease
MSLMFGVVGLVLLLTCTNVAGLLLARYAARGREIAVRAAIGADRRRLIRQLLVESALLATLAGVAGLAFGAWLVRAIARFQPPGPIPLHFDIGLDPSVVAFTLGATLLTAFLFGLAPALHASRLDLVPALKEGSAASTGGASRLRTALVVSQVAVSLVLLVGAGLAITSLRNARSLSPGFEPDGQLTARLDLGLQGYDQEAARQFVGTLRDEASALPGVRAVGFAVNVPLSLSSWQRGAVPEGFEVEEGVNPPSIDYNLVDESYFEAMGIPLLRGRGFERTDGPEAEPVLVVNRAFAERYWPGDDPLGRVVETAGRPHVVVGLVPTGRYFSLGEEPKPFMYLPLAQNFGATLNLHVRASGDPMALATTLRRRVAGMDAALPFQPRTMHEAMGLALLPAQMAAGTVSVFAVVALLLAAVGLYGVLAYLVRQSSREIAIRMAVGARANHVLALVIGRGLRLVAWGIAIGLPLGALLARPMSGLLYGVGALDLPSFALAVGGLLAVTAAACLLPARRATRVDPLAAMRVE